MSRRRLVIFDVDGTLVDSQAEILGAMADAFATQGLPVPPDSAVKGIVGLSLPVAIAALVPGLEAARQAALVSAYKAGFNARRLAHGVAGSPFFPGARAALERLGARYRLGVATGKSRRGLDGLIQGHGLQGLFCTTQVADDHPSKPHPAMILACLAATGVAPGDAVIIGDTEFDMEMGRAAGVRRIGVTWGYHPVARLTLAEGLIDRFDQLDAALEGLWGQA